MEIEAKNDSLIVIRGNIKSLDDYTEIKRVSQQLISGGASHITFDISESLSMVSSVIGHLIKMINVDKVNININVTDERLYSLLEQLNLVDLFNVEKV